MKGSVGSVRVHKQDIIMCYCIFRILAINRHMTIIVHVQGTTNTTAVNRTDRLIEYCNPIGTGVSNILISTFFKFDKFK
jgi:hypothetical protein